MGVYYDRNQGEKFKNISTLASSKGEQLISPAVFPVGFDCSCVLLRMYGSDSGEQGRNLFHLQVQYSDRSVRGDAQYSRWPQGPQGGARRVKEKQGSQVFQVGSDEVCSTKVETLQDQEKALPAAWGTLECLIFHVLFAFSIKNTNGVCDR